MSETRSHRQDRAFKLPVFILSLAIGLALSALVTVIADFLIRQFTGLDILETLRAGDVGPVQFARASRLLVGVLFGALTVVTSMVVTPLIREMWTEKFR